MLVEEVVDRFRRSAMAARRLKGKRVEDRACCLAEVVVLVMLEGLGPSGAHQDVVARVMLRWVRLVSERGAVLEVLVVGSSQGVGGGDVNMPVLGGRVVDGRDAREEDVRLKMLLGKGLALVAVMCV